MPRSPIFAVLLALALNFGCGPAQAPPPSGDGPLPITVSLPPQQWLVERIGGGRVAVTALVSPGDSPATYQPTDAQVSRTLASRAYFHIGVPFERGPWFQALRAADRLRTCDLAAGVERRPMAHHGGADEHGMHGDDPASGLDPHVWLSPRLLEIQAGNVVEVLAELAPEHRDEFELNRQHLVRDLRQLDADLRQQLEPLAGRAFFVFHPAWGYFADAYGLRQVAVEVAGQQPTDRELTELQNLARQEGVRTVFVQPQIAGAGAAAVARAIDGEVVVLDPLAPDPLDNLRRVAAAIVRAHSPASSRPG